MGKDHIFVKVDIATIKKALHNKIGSFDTPATHILINAIVENLAETEVGLQQLYMALSGIEATSRFRVGDTVLIPWGLLPTWRLDFDKTQEAGLIVKECLVAEVTEINLRRSNPLTVVYKAVKKNEAEPVEETYVLSETDNIILANEDLPDADTL